jgi:replication fork protection complex subunit Csm3/Swi3
MDPAGRADEFFNDPFSFQDPLAAGGADEEPPRKKRVVATVDKDRLLGPHGFPALIKLAKRWRPKGKGHEVS